MADIATILLQILSEHLPESARKLYVAYSGGVDSHVLLHCLTQHRTRLPPIHAIHINHGISDQASDWADHCQSVCHQLNVPLNIINVTLTDGEGLEDQARRARYAAFADNLDETDVLLTAQHQSDQAETFLLQAIRGGGPRGIAAMPLVAPIGKTSMIRPMLSIPQQKILDYAHAHQLQWVHDSSNDDIRFDRNFLRQQIMPVLRQRWPAIDQTLSRCASHTASMLHDYEHELEHLLSSIAISKGVLSIKRLRGYDRDIQGALLQQYCRNLSLPAPSTQITHEILTQMQSDNDRQPCIRWQEVECRRYQDGLYFMPSLPEVSNSWQYSLNAKNALYIPELGGELRLELVPGNGIPAELVESGLTVVPRPTGQSCRPAGDAHQRTLKSILQGLNIPVWERDRLPYILHQGTLLAIADKLLCEPKGSFTSERYYQPVWQLK